MDLRNRLHVVYHKVDEKTSKVYVDYCISTCLPKEAIITVNERLDKGASKEELAVKELDMNEKIDKLREELSQFKFQYASKDEVWSILD
jgi:hypothetical protein